VCSGSQDKLRNKLLEDLESTHHVKAQQLLTLLRSFPKNIKLHFNQWNRVFLVNVHAFPDRFLLNQAEKPYAFPRGFALLWEPCTSLLFVGFYPKFENDRLEQQSTDLLGFEHCKTFLKWSGFLSMLVVFEVDDEICWTVSSKNRGGGDFALDGARIWKEFVSEELCREMLEHNLSVCAETLSFNDQTHGSIVRKECPLVTAVGTGIRIMFGSKEREELVFDNGHPSQFISFFSHEQVVEFCHKFKLAVDSALLIDSVACVDKFVNILCEHRDNMSFSLFRSIVDEIAKSSPDHVTILPGSVDHDAILGDVLEGLVMFLWKDKDHTPKIKKFKFPGYTCRTMVLRPVFEFPIIANFKTTKILKNWAGRWCSTEKGKEFWMSRVLQAIFLKLEGNVRSPGISEKVADHIVAMDKALGLPIVPLEEVLKMFEELYLEDLAGTVIIVLGPIGSGKSSIGQCLKSFLCLSGYDAVHIDGDELGFSPEEVLRMGSERNGYTLWMIYRAILANQIPIISTGGGALFGYFKNEPNQMLMLENLATGFSQQFKTLVLIPREDSMSRKIIELDPEDDYLSIYDDMEIVENAVRRRLADPASSWTVSSEASRDSFVRMIVKKSNANERFARLSVDICDSAFTFPVIRPSDFESGKLVLDFNAILPSIVAPTKVFRKCKIMQKRILTRVILDGSDPCLSYHITLLYDHKCQTTYSIKDYESDSLRYLRDYIGYFVELQGYDEEDKMDVNVKKSSKSKKRSVSLIVVDDVFGLEQYAHVTISPGPHQPNQMRDVALALRRGQDSISLPDQSQKKTWKYSLSLLSEYPRCTVQGKAVFCLLSKHA
jgi:hypothetical protein